MDTNTKHAYAHTGTNTQALGHCMHTCWWSEGKELIIDIPMFLCEHSDCRHYLLIQLHAGKLQGREKKQVHLFSVFS